jgi:hypothetical protein
LLGLGGGGLLLLSRLLFFGRRILLLLLHRLLLGLLFRLVLSLLDLSGRRLAVVIVISATHQCQSSCADSGASAGSQQ